MIVFDGHTGRRSKHAALLRTNAHLIAAVTRLRRELEAAERRAQISLTALQLFLGDKAKSEQREAA